MRCDGIEVEDGLGAQPGDQAVFRALGAIAISVDGNPLPIGGEKPRRLLAALLLHRGTVMSIGQLMDVLWGDDVPDTGVTTLQAYVSRLRRLLPPNADLVSEAPGYRLAVGTDATDVDRFEAGLAAARAMIRDRPGDALVHLDAALAEWRGEAFAEFAEEPWAQAEVARLGELRLHAREERLAALLALGLDDRTVGEAQALTVEQPWREQPWRALLTALHRAGRQGDALRAASAFRARLRDELGLDPSPEFIELEREIATDAPRRQREMSSVPAVARPAGVTIELVGREHDVAFVEGLVHERRLVTLLGPGGVGKTQLALSVAGRIATRSGVTTAVVELAPVRTDSGVVAAVATQLGVQTQQGRSLLESILELLAAKPLLLVLDNCEHVLDTIAAFVQRLLQGCPAVDVLATSREPLGLPHETVYQVPTLPVADPQGDLDAIVASPAVELFLQRASAANRQRPSDEATVRAVAELCDRLDGVPLAIELAAARTRAFSPTEMIERLGDRFGLLAGSSRVADERHRSLRTLVDWSYQLLDPQAQQLFQRLSTFAGAFDLDAAEQVCGYGDVPRSSIAALLASLVDKSMVQASGGHRTDYRLLETLREYGAALSESDAPELARRHAAWLAEVCERGAVGLHGPDEGRWLDTFERLFDDLRLAVRNALDNQDAGTALRIVVAAREHAFRRLRYELVGWAETTLATVVPSQQPLSAAALGIVAYGRFVRGEIDAAIDLGQRALTLADECGTDTYGIAERTLGNACFFRGDMDSTFDAVARQLDGANAACDDARIAHAYYMASLGETRTGDAAAGSRHANLAMDAARRSGNPTAIAQAAYCLGIWAAATDPARAREELARSEALAGDVGNHWFELFARTETLWLQALDGDPYPALAGYADVLVAWHRAGDWANQWLSLRHVFGICCQVGADELAMIIHSLLERADATDAYPFEPAAAADLARTVDDLRLRLGDRVTALELQGRTGTTSAVIDVIVDRLTSLGDARSPGSPTPTATT
jgi:predicted ATPase/DNA-binding SARP family transcriptional activator